MYSSSVVNRWVNILGLSFKMWSGAHILTMNKIRIILGGFYCLMEDKKSQEISAGSLNLIFVSQTEFGHM